MRISKRVLAVAFLVLALAAGFTVAPLAAVARAGSFEYARWRYADFFEYDRDLPFNLVEKVEKETETYRLLHWSFDTTHGKRVTAYFIEPKNAAKPWPVVLGMHGYGGSKSEIAGAADTIVGAGYAALAIDAEYHGERKVEGKEMYSKLVYSTRDAMVQTIVDFRRGIDLLEATRRDVDVKRVGFVGGSMGGILGAVFTAVEPRVRASVLIVGGADWSYLARASVVAQALGLTSGDHPIKPKEFSHIIAPADPINWAQVISPRPVLMLNGTHDVLVNPKANIFLFNRLKAPKKIVWFNEGHGLPLGPALDMAMKFYDTYLKGEADPMSLGEVVEGYKTEPLNMKLGKPLPEPVLDMPLRELFLYDDFLPLKATAEGSRDYMLKSPVFFDVSFLSVHDSMVTGELGFPGPAEKGPYPAVVLVREPGGEVTAMGSIPGGQGMGGYVPGSFFRGFDGVYRQDDVIAAALNGGFAVLAIDAPHSGKRSAAGRGFYDAGLPHEGSDNSLQLMFDIRRAVDFLGTRGDVKLGAGAVVVAQGRGAFPAATAAAVADDRISKVVLLGGRAAEAPAVPAWAAAGLYADALKGKKVFVSGEADEVVAKLAVKLDPKKKDALKAVFEGKK